MSIEADVTGSQKPVTLVELNGMVFAVFAEAVMVNEALLKFVFPIVPDPVPVSKMLRVPADASVLTAARRKGNILYIRIP